VGAGVSKARKVNARRRERKDAERCQERKCPKCGTELVFLPTGMWKCPTCFWSIDTCEFYGVT